MHVPAEVCTTIHHWQLRDLVSAGDSSDEMLCVCDSSVLHYNCATREVSARRDKARARVPTGAA